MPRGIIAVLALAVGLGCGTGIIIDDWGTTGYAQLEGVVTRADGKAYARGSVFFSCGYDRADGFGHAGGTDAAGRYAIDVDVPGMPLPESRELICRVSAPGDAPAFAAEQTVVSFGRTARERTRATLDLREGRIAP